MVCTPLQFITSIELTVEEVLGKQVAFSENKLCLNRVFQFHEDAAYLRLQRSASKDAASELVATIAVRSVPGENGVQAIQGECSHASLSIKKPFFFAQPQDKACKKFLTDALEAFFLEVETLEKERLQLESGKEDSVKALESPEEMKAEEKSEADVKVARKE